MHAWVVWVWLALASVWSGCAAAQELTAVAGFGRAWGENPGNLLMHEYVPADAAGPLPVVVVLHGCNQGARLYAGGSGWLGLAAAGRFALVVPEQKKVNNPYGCFNWFMSGDNGVLPGEQVSIINMVEHLGRRMPIDRGRVYVTGLSAGGGMTAVMLAVYPNRFAAGAIIAGVPYRCAAPTTAMPPVWMPGTGGLVGSEGARAYACMDGYVDRTPDAWGTLVRGIAAQRLRHPFGGPWPAVAIWQGMEDRTVVPKVSGELVEQWTNVHGVPPTPGRVEPVPGAAGPIRHEIYAAPDGRVLVERYLIEGFPHATPIDPPPSAARCGNPEAYIQDAGLCAALVTARSWGLVP